MEGLVLFNKPSGLTSTQIVNYFKKITKKKVGHGGTLDPLANGLLILGIGEFTKELTKFLKESTKTYIAEIVLGAKSNTYDKEGKIEVVSSKKVELEEIKKTLNEFLGEIEQIPPPFSAVKIKGKPAYQYARLGEKIDLKPRKVKIYEIRIINYSWPNLKLELKVSSGAYIRSLANDLGEKLGVGAYLNGLVRTKIDEFNLDEALTFEDLKNNYLEFLAKVYGRVQGVGFRFFCYNWAKNLKIFGYAKNLNDGSVEILAQGREENLQKFLEKIKQGPKLAKIEKLEVVWRKAKNKVFNFETL